MMTMHQIGNRYELLFLSPILSAFQFAFKLSVVQVAYMVRWSCRISNPDFITHAYMVLTGLKTMRFVDQIQYADAISLSSWLCYFFGGLAELGKCRITYNKDVFFSV
jgi:hypothetical protein